MNRTRILVVDDEVYIAHILEFSLGMEGFEVLTASSGPEALSALSEYHPDLVVLDIMMPGMDGYEVCRRIRAGDVQAQLPIVMLSASHGESERAQAKEVGASAYVTKPFRPADLMGVIRGLLDNVPGSTEGALRP